MNGVLAHEQWNAQTVLGGHAHGFAAFFARNMQNGTGEAGLNKGKIVRTGVPHDELAHFLFQGHTSEQIGHALFYAQRRVQISRLWFWHCLLQ
ncbi:hypothetical protein SDC9_143206 [bioreactor metagenome]|uniref:Uncharacterized protein n=1 Tax=bioreactor metagenome TaxID=1076179 RepID=A0A645E2P7_9ZZZZ